MPVYNVLIAGIGGQGVITLGTYLKKAALRSGLHVSGSERRGGAQREGHVSSIIRYQWSDVPAGADERHEVCSPLIPSGGAHLLIGLEPLEALRVSRHLQKDSVVVLNLSPIPPVSVRLGEASYPPADKILDMLRTVTENIFAWNLTQIAEQAFGTAHAANGISLGIASRVAPLPVSETDLIDTIRQEGRPEELEHFRLGVELSNERR